MTLALHLQHISKSYPERRIIDDLSFSFEKGCYCLSGANGIGKSTILELIAGSDHPDQGQISLQTTETHFNHSQDYKKQLCYVPSNPNFFPTATGHDFINFILSVKQPDNQSNLDALNELISAFKLSQYLDCPFAKMSLGTQKKLFLTTLAIGQHSLVILDEPTNGLDKQANQVLVQLLAHIKKTAIVIIVSHDPAVFSELSPIKIHIAATPVNRFIISEVSYERFDPVLS